MHVVVEHVFASLAPAAYEALYFDEEFNAALGRELALGRKLLRLERAADRIVRHVQYEPSRDPASPAGQAFGKSRASFIEELDYERGPRRGRWRTVPSFLAERVTNTGTLELVDEPGGGVRRIVRADVKVSLFGFGGRVEKIIAAEIVKSYTKSAAFTEQWLARSR